MSNIRATLLNTIKEQGVNKKDGYSTQDFKKYFGVTESKKFSQNLYQLVKEGLIKKASKNAGSGYLLTTKGIKQLMQWSDKIWTIEQVQQWINTGPGPAPKETTRYSPTAHSAIEGISELIHINDRLTNTLRSVHSQLGLVLNELNPPQEDETNE